MYAVLCIHGDSDKLVDVSESQRIVQKLADAYNFSPVLTSGNGRLHTNSSSTITTSTQISEPLQEISANFESVPETQLIIIGS